MEVSCKLKFPSYRISSIKALGAYFFYFRIASFITEQGLIRIIIILPVHVPYHVQKSLEIISDA